MSGNCKVNRTVSTNDGDVMTLLISMVRQLQRGLPVAASLSVERRLRKTPAIIRLTKAVWDVWLVAFRIGRACM